MMTQNPLYGIIDQSYIQKQLIMQSLQRYPMNQQWKNIECAQKFDDFLQNISEVAPEYQHAAICGCCLVAEKYMGPRQVVN